jgi:hypothetical protein
LLEFVADQPRERQMLALTCHAHVATLFAAAGAAVRSLSDASPRWLPAPAAAPTPVVSFPVEPTPPAPSPPPQHVAIVAETSGDAWEAERFFFGTESPSPQSVVSGRRKRPRR